MNENAVRSYEYSDIEDSFCVFAELICGVHCRCVTKFP